MFQCEGNFWKDLNQHPSLAAHLHPSSIWGDFAAQLNSEQWRIDDVRSSFIPLVKFDKGTPRQQRDSDTKKVGS